MHRVRSATCGSAAHQTLAVQDTGDRKASGPIVCSHNVTENMQSKKALPTLPASLPHSRGHGAGWPTVKVGSGCASSHAKLTCCSTLQLSQAYVFSSTVNTCVLGHADVHGVQLCMACLSSTSHPPAPRHCHSAMLRVHPLCGSRSCLGKSCSTSQVCKFACGSVHPPFAGHITCEHGKCCLRDGTSCTPALASMCCAKACNPTTKQCGCLAKDQDCKLSGSK